MREICESATLADGGKGVRFMVERHGETLPAFAIRYGGRVCAYINRCPHFGSEFDWIEGEFFDSAALLLICATHGAAFMPDSGYCVSGTCKGQASAIATEEVSGKVYLVAPCSELNDAG